MDRRDFIKLSGTAVSAIALSGSMPSPSVWTKKDKTLYGPVKKGHFTMTQISSATDTIGESYLFRTTGGKVIMVDGGFASDVDKLRRHLVAAGNHVDLWFITHPHEDHMEALARILVDRQGITIDKVIYSRVSDSFLDCEPKSAGHARSYYRTLDDCPDKTDFLNLHIGGQRFDIDGIGIMVLGTADMSVKHRNYNNMSMAIRFWDNTKSVVILGDAGIECGNNLLANWREYLDCDYLQMAHHGQNGCSEEFYKTVNFSACIWPTPSRVWNPAPGSPLKTMDTRRWMDEKGIKEHHVSCLEEDWTLL